MTQTTPTILILNGPNLNLLGRREPEIYGTETLSDITGRLIRQAESSAVTLDHVQSNHEGVLIDTLHGARGRVAGAVINAGGLTHTSVALRDAVNACDFPLIEVHLSNIHAREEFRHRSLLAPVVAGSIVGLGARGYELALTALMSMLPPR